MVAKQPVRDFYKLIYTEGLRKRKLGRHFAESLMKNEMSHSRQILKNADLAAVHSHVRFNSNDELGRALVHIFCFKGSCIAELRGIGELCLRT